MLNIYWRIWKNSLFDLTVVLPESVASVSPVDRAAIANILVTVIDFRGGVT